MLFQGFRVTMFQGYNVTGLQCFKFLVSGSLRGGTTKQLGHCEEERRSNWFLGTLSGVEAGMECFIVSGSFQIVSEVSIVLKVSSGFRSFRSLKSLKGLLFFILNSLFFILYLKSLKCYKKLTIKPV